MPRKLVIEYFDRDSSSYKHRLEIPLHEDERVFVDSNSRVLNVRSATGWQYIPLDNVKRWYKEEDRLAKH